MKVTKRPPIPIVCFGDSITASGWPAVVQAILAARGITVDCINAGIRGNTTSQALWRMDKDVLSRRPEIVIEEFGFNDCNQVLNSPRPRTSRPDFRNNLDAVLTRIRSTGAESVLTANHRTLLTRALSDGRPYEAHSEEYTAIVRECAASSGTPLLDMRALFPGPDLALADALVEDGIHLSAAGIERYGEIAARFLLQTFPERLQSDEPDFRTT